MLHVLMCSYTCTLVYSAVLSMCCVYVLVFTVFLGLPMLLCLHVHLHVGILMLSSQGSMVWLDRSTSCFYLPTGVEDLEEERSRYKHKYMYM